MNRTRLLKHLVILMFFIFISNFLALKFYWYSLVWYFDIFMHILGGIWVGMFFLYVFTRKNKVLLNFKLIIKTLLLTLLVGILWEIYEFYIHQYLSRIPFDEKDTVLDVFFDLFGFMISCFYFSKFIMSSKENRLQ